MAGLAANLIDSGCRLAGVAAWVPCLVLYWPSQDSSPGSALMPCGAGAGSYAGNGMKSPNNTQPYTHW